MKKLTLLTLAASVVAVPAMATNVEYFVGGGLGGQFNGVTISDEDGKWFDESGNAMNMHLRGGLVIEQNHRVTFTANFAGDAELFSHTDSDGEKEIYELKQSEFLVSYDYLHNIAKDIDLFVGVSTGWVKNKLSGEYIYDDITEKDSISDTSFAMGFQVGAQYRIDNNWSTDLTYRHMFSSMDKKFGDDEYFERVEVEGHGALTLSLDYRF